MIKKNVHLNMWDTTEEVLVGKCENLKCLYYKRRKAER